MLSQLSIGKVQDRDVEGCRGITLYDVIALCLKMHKDMLMGLQDRQHRLPQQLRICIGWEAQHPGDVVLCVFGIVDAVHIDARL